MTTFDGSTGQYPATPDGEEWVTPSPEVEEPGVDTLEMLRQAVADQEELEPTIVDVPPGNAMRLVCSTVLESRQLNAWQRKALPPQKRHSPKLSPLDVDQSVFNSTVLINLCERVEVYNKASGQWRTVQDDEGRPLTFKDQALLRELRVIDPQAALKKLFPRDPDLIRAGQLVLAKAGWADEDEDADDADPR